MFIFIAMQTSDCIVIKKEEVLKITKKQIKSANHTVSKSDIDAKPVGIRCIGTTPEKALEVLVNRNKEELEKAEKSVFLAKKRLDNALKYCVDESSIPIYSLGKGC